MHGPFLCSSCRKNSKHFNKHIRHMEMDSRFLTTNICAMTQLHRIIRYANNKIRYILARTQPVLLNIDYGKGI